MAAMIRRSVAEMTGYTPGEQARAGTVIKLNTNENPYPPSPQVLAALADVDGTALKLYPDPVCSELRERIAEIHGCTAAQVFVGNGSDEVLALCTQAFVENNGGVAYFDPSYSLYPVLTDVRAVRRCPVPLGPSFEWPGDMSAVGAASLFLMTCPNAPTGIQYPRASVLAFCRAFDGVVVVDEAYVDFSKEHFMELAVSEPNVLVARTLSKSFSLAGLRVGYAVGPERLVGAMFKIKDSYNVDAISQWLALAALSDMVHMRHTADCIRATRKRLEAALVALGWDVAPSETNFVWARPCGSPADEVFERLRERRILIRHFPGERTGEYVRITVGTNEDIDALLEAIRRIQN